MSKLNIIFKDEFLKGKCKSKTRFVENEKRESIYLGKNGEKLLEIIEACKSGSDERQFKLKLLSLLDKDSFHQAWKQIVDRINEMEYKIENSTLNEKEKNLLNEKIAISKEIEITLKKEAEIEKEREIKEWKEWEEERQIKEWKKWEEDKKLMTHILILFLCLLIYFIIR